MVATSDAHTTARELYATLVNTAIAASLNQLRAALPKLEEGSDDPKAVKAALPRNTSSDIRNFLVSMAEQGTLDQLADIINVLEQYNQEAPTPPSQATSEPSPSDSSARQRSTGTLQAEVVSPGSIDQVQKSRITNDLQQLYGSQLDIQFVEDASLKRGMIVRLRDLTGPNKLAGQFSEIIQMFESGEEHLLAEVVSAVPLSQEQRDRISRELQHRYDATLDLHFREDESLIGGLIIRVGDQVLDNSLRARMGNIQRNMLTS